MSKASKMSHALTVPARHAGRCALLLLLSVFCLWQLAQSVAVAAEAPAAIGLTAASGGSRVDLAKAGKLYVDEGQPYPATADGLPVDDNRPGAPFTTSIWS